MIFSCQDEPGVLPAAHWNSESESLKHNIASFFYGGPQLFTWRHAASLMYIKVVLLNHLKHFKKTFLPELENIGEKYSILERKL